MSLSTTPSDTYFKASLIKIQARCYSPLFCRFGPLIRLWSMRFEGKHKLFKAAARGASFKNILKTFTQHHQRLMANNLHFDDTFASVTTTTGTGTQRIFSG